MSQILGLRSFLLITHLSLLITVIVAGCRSGAAPPSAGGGGRTGRVMSFTDVTAAAGIDFRHENGAVGQKLMPETMGSGCAFLDYDNDGWQDLLLVNGERWGGVQAFRPGTRGAGDGVQALRPVGLKARTPSPAPRVPGPTMLLYRNDGTGRFHDVTAAVGLDIPMYGMGVAVGDWDNDGFDDLAVTALGGVYLFHNLRGRRFALVNRQGPTLRGGWPTSAAWLDYDRDGRLDLFVCHYVQWTPQTDVYWSLDGVHKSYTTPEKYQGESCRLYRNEGDGRFTDVTDRAGIFSTRSKALGVAVCDYDADGWPDLVVSNDTEPTLVYHNQGDGRFREVGTELGVAVAESGKPKAGMGIDTGDDQNDGSESILVTNFAGEQISLYRKDATGLFLDDAARAGVGAPSQLYLGFGTFFFDADLDGWLDIFVTNGHVMDDIEWRNTGVAYAEPALLFLNDGDGRYNEVSRAAGPALTAPQVGRGAACGDYDNDGDLDLLLTANGGRARLLRNDSASTADPAQANGWLKLQFQGGPSNRDAIGARVRVRVGERTMTRTVKSGSSYLSSNDRRLTFGLGRAARADEIEIQWPTGAVQSLGPVERNRWLRITEGPSGTGAAAR